MEGSREEEEEEEKKNVLFNAAILHFNLHLRCNVALARRSPTGPCRLNYTVLSRYGVPRFFSPRLI